MSNRDGKKRTRKSARKSARKPKAAPKAIPAPPNPVAVPCHDLTALPYGDTYTYTISGPQPVTRTIPHPRLDGAAPTFHSPRVSFPPSSPWRQRVANALTRCASLLASASSRLDRLAANVRRSPGHNELGRTNP